MSLLDEDFDLDIKDLIISGLMHLMNMHNKSIDFHKTEEVNIIR